MYTPTVKSRATVRCRANFRTIDERKRELISRSLTNNYFAGCAAEYLATDFGRSDFENHLFGRLDRDRNIVIPWLNSARPLQGASILEIGCGTGCSTVALSEQGARVIAIDVNEGSLAVAKDRCVAYGLEAEFLHANATEVRELFSGRCFDLIIFYAALEHMTVQERMSAMRATWNMLSEGSLWCVIETPNRLWYFDAHTSLLPFHMWLPDELAFEYSRFSPRANYRELYREPTDESTIHFLRRGRGVSFHEFELALKPVRDLKVRSLNPAKQKRGPLSFLTERFSVEKRYLSLLRKIAPEVHDGFLQSFLYLIIEKD